MEVQTAYTNRLGNRTNNQDRCLVVERPGRVLLVVADGMGGHAGGELAAQTATDSLSRSFLEQRGAISEPHTFLKNALLKAHLDVVDGGRLQEPPIEPRTTVVACLVQDDRAWWAHLGDSRLYLLRDGQLVTRTRDHTPVEELLQSGVIGEQELRTHPLRNGVSRCLGGKRMPTRISLDEARLQAGDTLLLCSDGLWSALPERQMIGFPTDIELEKAINQFADDADVSSYPKSDNISLVGLRWLSSDHSAQLTNGKTALSQPAETKQEKDPLQQAIDDIHRAMLEYASELKK